MSKPMTPGQILGICFYIATELESTEITLEEAQLALRNPACRKNILTILKNGGNLPGPYGKLSVLRVHKEGENALPGSDYLARAREKTGGRANQSAFDFYRRKENWHLLPDKDENGDSVEVIVFVDTEFASGGGQCLRCLDRRGARWEPRYGWVGRGFYRRGLVGVLASPSDSST